MWACSVCFVSEDSVVEVAACSNRCRLFAHPACFQQKTTSSQRRKKHHRRGNSDFEVCLLPGCQGKMKALPFFSVTTAAQGGRDAEGGCCFVSSRWGGPCRRKVVECGACVLHMQDAKVKRRMVEVLQEDNGVSVQTEGVDTRSASSQCNLDEATTQQRCKTISALKRGKAKAEKEKEEAMVRLALRVTEEKARKQRRETADSHVLTHAEMEKAMASAQVFKEEFVSRTKKAEEVLSVFNTFMATVSRELAEVEAENEALKRERVHLKATLREMVPRGTVEAEEDLEAMRLRMEQVLMMGISHCSFA